MNREQGRPVVGSERNMLGVRVPPAERHDVVPDENGCVGPGDGGLSVRPSISSIPLVFIPRSYRILDKRYKAARGEPPLAVFRLGQGAFVEDDLTEDLRLVPDGKAPVTHGVIGSKHRVETEAYQQALAATRDDWELLDGPDES